MAQTVTKAIAGKGLSAENELAHGIGIQLFRYTPFGEQQHTKASGFTYNAEAYDAGTSMLNLRSRQYELAMNRFSQKDILKGQITTPLSLNRYGYCVNSPTMLMDPSGMSLVELYNVIHDFNPKKVFDNVLKNKKTNYSEVRKNDGVRINVIRSINDTLQTVYNIAIQNLALLNMQDQKLLYDAQKHIKEINESNLSVEEKQKLNNGIMSRTCLALSISMNSGNFIALTYEEDEDPNRTTTVEEYKTKMDYEVYNGNIFDYAEAHWDDEPRYPNGDCMNYLSSVASNNGLPQSEEWKPGSKAWKGTKNNYSYMTNANGITNVAFAGEIPFANSEEAKAMMDVGLLTPQSGDFLYNFPSDQNFPDHGYVINGFNAQTNYPQVTAHTTNRLNTDFDEAIDLAPIQNNKTYTYSIIYMGGYVK